MSIGVRDRQDRLANLSRIWDGVMPQHLEISFKLEYRDINTVD